MDKDDTGWSILQHDIWCNFHKWQFVEMTLSHENLTTNDLQYSLIIVGSNMFCIKSYNMTHMLSLTQTKNKDNNKQNRSTCNAITRCSLRLAMTSELDIGIPWGSDIVWKIPPAPVSRTHFSSSSKPSSCTTDSDQQMSKRHHTPQLTTVIVDYDNVGWVTRRASSSNN